MSAVKDPTGRFPLGIIKSPPLAIRNDEGTGFWILDHDGKVYFGHQIPPPEMGFGVVREQVTVPQALMVSAAKLISGMYEALEAEFEAGEDDEAFELLPEILMEGMSMDDDEAHDHAESILEEAERLNACPWKLAAMYISGVGWGSEKPDIPAVTEVEEKPDGKLLQFPVHLARPSAGTTH